MADDDHMADVVSPVVVDDGAKHVFTPDRNVEMAFSHWGCGISAPVVENMLVVVLAGVKMWFHKLGIVKAIEDSSLLIDRRLCRVTVRAFTMGWMRYSPEWLDTERNPGNCWIRHIHRLSTATCGS